MLERFDRLTCVSLIQLIVALTIGIRSAACQEKLQLPDSASESEKRFLIIHSDMRA